MNPMTEQDARGMFPRAFALGRQAALQEIAEWFEGKGYYDVIGHEVSDVIRVQFLGEPEPAEWVELEVMDVVDIR